jgi:hypothetical protein
MEKHPIALMQMTKDMPQEHHKDFFDKDLHTSSGAGCFPRSTNLHCTEKQTIAS